MRRPLSPNFCYAATTLRTRGDPAEVLLIAIAVTPCDVDKLSPKKHAVNLWCPSSRGGSFHVKMRVWLDDAGQALEVQRRAGDPFLFAEYCRLIGLHLSNAGLLDAAVLSPPLAALPAPPPPSPPSKQDLYPLLEMAREGSSLLHEEAANAFLRVCLLWGPRTPLAAEISGALLASGEREVLVPALRSVKLLRLHDPDTAKAVLRLRLHASQSVRAEAATLSS